MDAAPDEGDAGGGLADRFGGAQAPFDLRARHGGQAGGDDVPAAQVRADGVDPMGVDALVDQDGMIPRLTQRPAEIHEGKGEQDGDVFNVPTRRRIDQQNLLHRPFTLEPKSPISQAKTLLPYRRLLRSNFLIPLRIIAKAFREEILMRGFEGGGEPAAISPFFGLERVAWGEIRRAAQHENPFRFRVAPPFIKQLSVFKKNS
ncbi:MAG: hypothetical protein M5R36_12685 [Deltaproteobacteria bacterium]|nr:hypothetical protein [Deltaproteobacteria bacterium]